ncbi:MAG: hypothetical protein QE278_10730 [Limnobacter sp.]|nr:hypothetical protein [Limnobacter sp.]
MNILITIMFIQALFGYFLGFTADPVATTIAIAINLGVLFYVCYVQASCSQTLLLSRQKSSKVRTSFRAMSFIRNASTYEVP